MYLTFLTFHVINLIMISIRTGRHTLFQMGALKSLEETINTTDTSSMRYSNIFRNARGFKADVIRNYKSLT